MKILINLYLCHFHCVKFILQIFAKPFGIAAVIAEQVTQGGGEFRNRRGLVTFELL